MECLRAGVIIVVVRWWRHVRRPELPDGDKVIAEVLRHVQPHVVDILLLDVLTGEPAHLASTGCPVAGALGEVALVLAAQSDELITDAIVFIISGLTVPPEVALIPRQRKAVLPSVPAKIWRLKKIFSQDMRLSYKL